MSKNVNYGVLKDYDGNEFLPITHSKLVYDENGNTVEDRLIALESEVDEVQEQNSFKTIKVGSTNIEADQAEDTLELAAGSGIKLTGDAANDKVTISHSNTITKKDGFTQTTNASASGDVFTVTEVKYDTEGHITGKQEKTITLPSDVSGNAGSADKLKNPINITITDGNGHNGNATSFNGSSNVTLDLPDTITANIEDKDGEYFFIDKEEKVVAKISGAGIETTDIKVTGDVYFNNTSLNTLANDVITGVEAGAGLTGGGSNGDVVLNIGQGSGITVSADSISHADTSSASSVTAANGKAINSLTIDTFGHVTAADTGNVINSITTTGNGNAITSASNSNGAVTFTKGATFKTQQTKVDDPAASGSTTAFIDSITQNTNGEITVTKKNITAATQSAAGSMSADDKKKLDNIASGAEVNQNAFSNVKVGSVTVAADNKTDTLEIAAGTGITLSGDATNDKITVTNAGVRSVSTGNKRGTVSVNTNGTAADIAVNGLGFEDDGSYHFIDNSNKVITKIDNAGVHATDFIIDGADTSLSGVKTQYTTLKSQLDNTKYAGSSSVGGPATSANKLNTDAGSSTNPVYFENGIPKATGSSLAKNITGNAASADKVNKALTIAGKTFDGSQAVSISVTDLGVTGAMIYKGTSSTEITDGGTQAPTISGSSVATSSLQKGNVVLYGSQEFVWAGSKWELLGDEGSYALKTTAISAGSGLTGGGTLAADRTISHADTSTLIGAQNAGTGNAITSITVDGFGHVTGTDTSTVVNKVKAGTGISVDNNTGEVTVNVKTATDAERGGIKIGYSESGKNYAVKLSSEKAYVNVPWTDVNVTNTKATTTKAYLTGTTSSSTNTGTQVFDTGVYLTETAGQLHVTTLEAATSILPDTSGGANIGTTALPWGTAYSKNFSALDGTNTTIYGKLNAQTTGTAETGGVGRLTLGNNTVTGTAGNAKGQILMYGSDAGYTVINPGHNNTGTVTITLPDNNGTLATIGNIGAGTGMNKVTDGDAITLNVNAGTGLTANADNITLNTASDSVLGGVKLSDSYTSSSSLPSAASGGIAATPRAVQLAYAAADGSIRQVATDTNNRIHSILPGTANGSIKYAKYSGTNGAEVWTDNVFVQGIGDSGDGNLYFVDNANKSNTYNTNDGMHSVDFTIDGVCTLKGLHTSFNTVEADYVSGIKTSVSGGLTLTATKGTDHSITLTGSSVQNTAGSTNTSSKIFLIGATSQAANPQTYSHDTAYVGTDGHLYSDSKQVVNLSGTQALTNKTYNGYTLAAACAKGVTDSTSAAALGTGTNLVTEKAVYHGLASINGARQTSSVGIYAPTAGGTKNYVLTGDGTTSAPVWSSSIAVDTSGNAATADKFKSAQTIKLKGDVTGEVSSQGGWTIDTTVADDSHNHIIDNIDGLQTTLNEKLSLTGGTMSGHIYLGGATANNSNPNTSQLIFGTVNDEHVAISSNTHAIIINPDKETTTNQIVLRLDDISTISNGISIGSNNSVNNTGTYGNKNYNHLLTGYNNKIIPYTWNGYYQNSLYTLIHGFSNEVGGAACFTTGGNNTITNGYCSGILGSQNTVDGPCSFAIGCGLQSKNSDLYTVDRGGQLVIGQYNSLDEESIFIVGNGSGIPNANDERNNALSVDRNGLTTIQSLAMSSCYGTDAPEVYFSQRNLTPVEGQIYIQIFNK